MKRDPYRLSAFHDESFSGPWFTTGIIWIPTDAVEAVGRALNDLRRSCSYWRESHFAELPGSIERQKLAKAWLQGFRAGTIGEVAFSALVVDHRSPNFEGGHFAENHFEYNRFTSMALWSGFRKFWKDRPEADIEFVSDERPRARRGPGALGTFQEDNFLDYLPRRFAEDARLKYRDPIPQVSSARTAPSHTNREEGEPHIVEDLLQLCDLLTGAASQAFSQRSANPFKSGLGHEFRVMANATLTPPWRSRPGFCDRLTVSQFPDERGQMREGRFEFARPGVRKLDTFE